MWDSDVRFLCRIVAKDSDKRFLCGVLVLDSNARLWRKPAAKDFGDKIAESKTFAKLPKIARI